jgi:hypothetical protein
MLESNLSAIKVDANTINKKAVSVSFLYLLVSFNGFKKLKAWIYS